MTEHSTLRPSRREILISLAGFPIATSLRAEELNKPTARDVWKICQSESRTVGLLSGPALRPLAQTYIQHLDSNHQVIGDDWRLAEVTVGEGKLDIVPLPLWPQASLRNPPPAGGGKGKHSKSKEPPPRTGPKVDPDSLVYMAMFPDSAGIDPERYDWAFAGVEQLGDFKTQAFLLKGKASAGAGAFLGKIWCVDYSIARWAGTFEGPSGAYASFDSLRYRDAIGRWWPWQAYFDQDGRPPYAWGTPAFRARVELFNFEPQAGIEGTVGIHGEAVDDLKHADEALVSEDVILEAESRFIDWLLGRGYVAPIGDAERKCDDILQEILSANAVKLNRRLSCRTLLTTPIETVLWESVIGLARSVVDLSPNDATIAMLLCRAAAQAVVRKDHFSLGWGRPDKLLGDRLGLLKGIRMRLPLPELEKADDLAIEYLQRLNYPTSELQAAQVFLYTASQACKTMPSLFQPRWGDGLPGNGHLSRLAMKAPPGEEQDPAMHIGARTETRPDNMVHLLGAVKEYSPYRLIPQRITPGGTPAALAGIAPGILPPVQSPHFMPPPTFPPAPAAHAQRR
jgi:hypothetical protein